MPFAIARSDITDMHVDAIVNAANAGLCAGGGVCGAIFAAAGMREMRDACAAIGYCATGSAVLTPGFGLPSRYVIHTVGPVWQGGTHGEAMALHNCYRRSLELALENDVQSIAFPLISSGIYGYPKAEALTVAVMEIKEFLAAHEMDVYIVVLDRGAVSLSGKLVDSVEAYIDEHYARGTRHLRRAGKLSLPGKLDNTHCFAQAAQHMALDSVAITGQDDLAGLSERIDNAGETFAQMLFRLIDEKQLDDVNVYKRANIGRKLFSKIRGDKDYSPSKKTVLALAIALQLSPEDTDALLRSAGYALSCGSKFDIIIDYFINAGNYDIFEINEVLFNFEQPLLY